MAELSSVAAALSTKVSDFWPARGRYFILGCLNLSPKILYAINAKIPSRAIAPTSDRFAVELVAAGTGVGVCMIVVVCVVAGEGAVAGATLDTVFCGAKIQLPLESLMYFVGLRYEQGSSGPLASALCVSPTNAKEKTRKTD